MNGCYPVPDWHSECSSQCTSLSAGIRLPFLNQSKQKWPSVHLLRFYFASILSGKLTNFSDLSSGSPPPVLICYENRIVEEKSVHQDMPLILFGKSLELSMPCHIMSYILAGIKYYHFYPYQSISMTGRTCLGT